MHRRAFLATGLAAAALSPARAQHQHHSGQFERTTQPGRMGLPELAQQHAVTDSPAPRAALQGRWEARSPLPIPRTEMAWAAELGGKMHLVGGYADTRFDGAYHHVYDPARDAWADAPAIPRGANHVGVATLDGKLYAFGGFIDQNRRPHGECFVFEGDRWTAIRPLPNPAGAIGCLAIGGVIHLVGGADGDEQDTRRSTSRHLVYDPREDRWSERRPLPTARDHIGITPVNGRFHVTGGRVDTFYTNSHYHHAYDAAADRWEMRAPIPTARSGHGAVWYRDRLFIMGGEGSNRVYGQVESYDPAADRWEAHAPMLTPRHGTGAVVIGDWIYVAGGGPQMGGGVKSAINEGFTLG